MILSKVNPVKTLSRAGIIISNCKGRQFSIHSALLREKKTVILNKPLREKTSANERGYVLLVIPFATFCLGTWQVQRRKWKLNLIKELEEKTTAEPVPFPTELEDLKDLEYRKVRIRGSFDHSKELYVFPRSPLNKNSPKGGGLISGKSSTGSQVITAFQVAGTNMRVLVNRGWVPKKKMDLSTRLEGQLEGETELVAVVRKPEKRLPFGAKNNPAANHWMNKDSEAMAEILNTQPIMLDADMASSVPGGPIGGQTTVSLRNEHFSYILTWYSLCAITTVLYYRQFWLRR